QLLKSPFHDFLGRDDL
ncbi:hypothetical protein CARUB_v10024878mg, partial [Capsella rubella]